MTEQNGHVDIRTVMALTPSSKTSLVDFLSKPEPVEDTSTEVETDDTSNDETVTDDTATDTVESESSDNVGSTETAENVEVSQPTVEYEVKGKKVPLKDLLNSFETREEISKRFDEVGKSEQKIKQESERLKKERDEIRYINEKFEEMHELVTAGNPLGALQIAMTMAIKDNEAPPEGLKDLIQQAINIADNFHGMTEDEQNLFLEKEEMAHRERKLTRKEKKQKELDDAADLRQFYTDNLEVNKVTEPEIDDAFTAIQSNSEHKKVFDEKDQKGKISYCTSYVLGNRLTKTITDGITKIDPELAKDTNFHLAILEHVDARCTVDDVAHIVKTYVDQVKGSAKAPEASQKDVAPPKPTTPTRAPTEKPKAEKANTVPRTWAEMVAKHSS